MKPNRNWILSLLAGSLLLPALPAGAAKSGEVDVQIPAFPVEINGVTIDSTKSEYPLLTYNGITYFPMTWNFSTALGLHIEWNNNTGLAITQDYAYHGKPSQDTGGSNEPGETYSARKPGYAVTVNGRRINNGSEEYPVLEFREITYFPMTWRFAVDEFKWNINWTSETGFKVISPQRKLLSEITADDNQFLYAYSNLSNSMYKIAKTLKETPVPLSSEESRKIAEQARSSKKTAAIDYSAYQGERTKRDNDIATFRGIELMPLKPFIDSNNAAYEKDTDSPNNGINVADYIAALGSERYLVTLAVYTQTHIPAPFTPHTFQTFVVDTAQKKAALIEGFAQPPEMLYKNDNGSCWITSSAPSVLTTRSADEFGQLALIDGSGNARLINLEYQVPDIDTLASLNGKLLIRMYSDRLYPHHRNDRDGIYLIDAAGKAEKKFDAVNGRVYADGSGAVYVVDADVNKITNLTQGQSKLWYDYELKE